MDNMKRGMTEAAAAEAAGVDRASLFNWQRRGKMGDGGELYAQFYQMLQQEKAKGRAKGFLGSKLT